MKITKTQTIRGPKGKARLEWTGIGTRIDYWMGRSRRRELEGDFVSPVKQPNGCLDRYNSQKLAVKIATAVVFGRAGIGTTTGLEGDQGWNEYQTLRGTFEPTTAQDIRAGIRAMFA